MQAHRRSRRGRRRAFFIGSELDVAGKGRDDIEQVHLQRLGFLVFLVVIEGDGFFQIRLPNGDTAYTRDGAWKLDENGTIVTSDGYTVLPEVQIPVDALGLNITQGGIIAVKMSEDADLEVLGQIELADFINPAGLKSIGHNLYQESGSSGAPVVGIPNTEGFGGIDQGFIEMSNVKVVEEMVNMIVAQRAYEANSKTIQTSDSMLQIANNLKR